MEIQVEQLISKIKNEGIKAAEDNAEKIIQDAEQKAESIIKDAEKKAVEITAAAQADALRFENSAKASVKQAGRDVILTVRKNLSDIFDRLLKTETDKALTANVMEEIIVNTINKWDKTETGNFIIEIPEKDSDTLQKILTSRLSEEIKNGLEIKTAKNMEKGFFISSKDGSAYFNFSDEGIAEALSEYLNPKLATLISGEGK
ncbi:MAG: V-type ATP synthase subunit E [Spirochaetota bacterium]